MHLATEQSFLPTVADASVTNAKISLSHSGKTQANFAASTFTIDAAPTGKTYNVHDLLVFLNGVCLTPTVDYTFTNNIVTLTGGNAPTGSTISVRYLPK